MNRIFDITPVPKPRMTRADKWKKRPAVLKYWAFADECRLKIRGIPIDGNHITFHIPMPKSWPKYKVLEMEGQYHRQRPDIDNYAKALLDALYVDDSCIADIRISKRWSLIAGIEIERMK